MRRDRSVVPSSYALAGEDQSSAGCGLAAAVMRRVKFKILDSDPDWVMAADV